MITDHQLREALQMLAEVLTQACYDGGGLLQTSGIGAYNDAIDLLARYGAAEYVGEQAGRIRRARINWRALQDMEIAR
ncbi:hypothetical protein [Candidatus Roseilinea sp. NK_OTU-006]|jgi:hypothetical protein|uniref:hypothetical protein n=1 Tax=Candidatus Roseilinea sp. NK_OTU-006 TaxID=2704250 RepID=UPI00145C9B56|nr:hypothetical protein [Candidatus Roseilinea sp. NK_OTU-006]